MSEQNNFHHTLSNIFTNQNLILRGALVQGKTYLAKEIAELTDGNERPNRLCTVSPL